MPKQQVQVNRDVLIQVLEVLVRASSYYDTYAEIEALRAALAEPVPRNQCGETCERAKLCAVCARGLADQPQTTHWQGCEEVHPECAIAEVERLRAFAAHPEQAEKVAYAAGWYQSMCAHCTDPRYAGVRCGVCGRSS